MNIAIVTGASSGIGREFAKQIDQLLKNSIDEIWLVARRKERLTELAGELHHKSRILAMDITKDAQRERLEDELKDANAKVRVLVGAAGYGMMGAFETHTPEDSTGQIRTNCEALTDVTARVLPFMQKGARIINLASSASFLPQVRFAVYAATKAYVLSFDEALGFELKHRGIHVTSVCPGPVKTEFFDIAESKGSTMSIKKYFMVSPNLVVRTALKDSFRGKNISIPGIPMKLFYVLTRIIPQRWLLGALALLYH